MVYNHAAWYRKWLKIRPENENKRVYLHFDGVFRDCLLYVNSYYVCRHEGGYESFYIDISDFLDYEKDNLIAVRITPEKHEGWWQEENVLHLLPHMNLKEKAGKKVDFYAFSNLDKAELFINGKSFGFAENKKDRYMKWENVDYELGTALAVGYKDGTEVTRCEISTVGEPFAIHAEIFKKNLSVGDTAIIDIKLADKNGNTVPDDDRLIKFNVSGAGRHLTCGVSFMPYFISMAKNVLLFFINVVHFFDRYDNIKKKAK